MLISVIAEIFICFLAGYGVGVVTGVHTGAVPLYVRPSTATGGEAEERMTDNEEPV